MKGISNYITTLGWRVKRAFLSRVAIQWRGREEDRFLAPDTYRKMLEQALHQALSKAGVEPEDVPSKMEKLKPELPNMLKMVGEQQYKGLVNWTPVIIRDWSMRLKRFEKTHKKLWGKGLDKLHALIALSAEIGEEANRSLRAESKPEKRLRVEVLTRLHARSIYVAHEIHSLLKCGYPDGALARWRSLHEIAVVANLLATGTDELITRYIEHDGIESWKAAKEFNAHAEALSETPFSSEDMARLEQRFNELEKKYGGSYTHGYGWAAEVLKTDGRFGLERLEKAVGLEKWRPHYRMASHPTHANPKSINFQLGDFDGSGVLVAGPSNYGLLDPAQCTAGAIFYCTLPLLDTRDSMYGVVMKDVLLRFVDTVGEEFFTVQKWMKEQENESNEAQSAEIP